jgi:hypothetical protein
VIHCIWLKDLDDTQYSLGDRWNGNYIKEISYQPIRKCYAMFNSQGQELGYVSESEVSVVMNVVPEEVEINGENIDEHVELSQSNL